MPLAEFLPLGQVDGVRLISLQKGFGAEQVAALTDRLPLLDWGPTLDEAGAFLDTAAIMQHLDLVITSDTAIAHLAGALGITVWVALGMVPDWRWFREREDSPWYPTMRLFRQTERGAWASVFQRMAGELARRVQR